MELNKQETILTKNSNIDAEEKLRKINITELMKNLKATSFWEKEGLVALIKLVGKLAKKIGEYENIISDDASGRLVSLTLQKIINRIRVNHNKNLAKILFVAGGAGINNRKLSINKLIENNKDKLGKTLLVTDYIQSGESIEQLIKILDSNNINFDVAAISVENDPESKNVSYSENLLKRLYYGEHGMAGLVFYSKGFFAGVYKNANTKEPFPERDFDKPTKAMRDVREDINLIADKIIEAIK